MEFGIFKVPEPFNEPVKDYAPGTKEREELINKCKELMGQEIEIPIIIGGKEYKTGNLGECRIPHKHKHLIGKYHKVGEKEIELAVKSALEARKEWSTMPFHYRASIFLKAADLITNKYRSLMNAACMLAQSKTCHQAEIDAVCELADFFRFNVKYAEEIYSNQPISPPPTWNWVEYRPLEGFVFAVTPFNFVSIAGNLPTSPAIMGNTVLWKPASASMYSSYFIYKVLKEAGLPDGVINMIPGDGDVMGEYVLKNPHLGGIHFTGSTEVFKRMWKIVGENIDKYYSYPRMVGETGGKDFMMVHESTDIEALVAAMIRGAFEYQGQKCSAASRAYIPDTIWPKVKDLLEKEIETIKVGDVVDFSNFMGAVITKKAYNNIIRYIEDAKKSDKAEVIIGGKYDDSEGYFIWPTVILAKDPHYISMEEEIFGPVLTIYVYPANKYEETLELCDKTSIYGLTGGVFAEDVKAIKLAYEKLRHSAGNFYINDKITGAIVAQQPFGGSRASGTNDKAGSYLNLIRWVTPRAIKYNLRPPKSYRYPFLEKE